MNALHHTLHYLDRRRPRTLTGWILAIILCTITYYVLISSARWYRIGKIQSAMERRQEISFIYDRPDGPRREAMRDWLENALEKIPFFAKNGHNFLHPASMYAERFNSLGHGRIIGIYIYYSMRISPSLGSALHPYRNIESFTFRETDEQAADAVDSLMRAIGEMKRLRVLDLECGSMRDRYLNHLHEMPELEELTLYGPEITDSSLPILLNFKKLKRLDIDCAKITRRAR